jgi:hypothetical protein
MKIAIILLPLSLLALSPFESAEPNSFDTSMYETKETNETKKASVNKKITCRYICDKKVYKEQQISSAVSFYKNLKENESSKD